MVRNSIQFQNGFFLPEVQELYGTKEQ